MPLPEYVFTGIIAVIVAVIEALAARDRRKAEKERKKEAEAAAEREKAREKIMVQLINSSNAAIALGEATAKAVQRIPDAHCNGDMKSALEYSSKVKHAMRDELTQQGVHAIWE